MRKVASLLARPLRRPVQRTVSSESPAHLPRLQYEVNASKYLTYALWGERTDPGTQPALVHGGDLGDVHDALPRQVGLPRIQKYVAGVPGRRRFVVKAQVTTVLMRLLLNALFWITTNGRVEPGEESTASMSAQNTSP